MGTDSVAEDGLTAFVQALRQLPPTGERGFEGFVRDVVQHVVHRQIRLLKSDPLLRKILEALGKRPKPDLWVIITTTQIKRNDLEQLRKAAELAGVGVECLDWDANPGALAGVGTRPGDSAVRGPYRRAQLETGCSSCRGTDRTSIRPFRG